MVVKGSQLVSNRISTRAQLQLSTDPVIKVNPQDFQKERLPCPKAQQFNLPKCSPQIQPRLYQLTHGSSEINVKNSQEDFQQGCHSVLLSPGRGETCELGLVLDREEYR
jgi:hypothetical protein